MPSRLLSRGPMRRVGPALLWLAVALAPPALAQSANGDSAEAEAPPRPARIAEARAADGLETHEFAARTEAVQEVDLSFRVPGLLEALPVQEGGFVAQGELIARLDPADYERKVRQAEVNLTSAQQDFNRKQQLVGQNAVPRQAFDDARNALDLAQVQLDQARQDLSYTVLRAPFDAIVSRRLLDSFTNVNAGQPVVRLQDVSELRVTADIPEYLVARTRNEDAVEVEAVFPFLADRTFPLAFRELSTEANDVAQTYHIAFGMPRPEDITILPGMTATIRARVKPENPVTGAVTVPAGALVPARPARDGEEVKTTQDYFVWVVPGGGGAVERRSVTVKTLTNERALITSGLTAGEAVVTAGVHALREGLRVRPMGHE